MAANTLYYGDNLDVLRRHVADESVDLVYLDPPFNSNATYNVLFAERNGSQAAAQIKAFEDTWHWDEAAARAYQEVVEAGGSVSQVMQAFRTFLGDNDMLAYLAMMAPRLAELRRVLKATGSIYLHCDPTASHYLKLVMDAVFGPQLFRNEIVWERTTGRKAERQFGRVHDCILLYTKERDAVWNPQTTPQTAENARGHDMIKGEDGIVCRLSDLSGAGAGPPRRFGDKEIAAPPGRHWQYDQDGIDRLMAAKRVFFSRGGKPRLMTPLSQLPGISVRDIWTDIDPINAAARERLGYPTQKPEALLERIVLASSNEGQVVLDPFCGCGTAVVAAQGLGRRWIGIDVTHLAIGLVKHRLRDAFGGKCDYEVLGEPTALPDARALAASDPYQFQFWALGLVDARSADPKKGADKGIDGRLYFHDQGAKGPTQQVILSVKAGHVTVAHLRDLRGVVERESAAIGVLISMEPPTGPMRTEAASAGFYESWGKQYPRLQLRTVEELLEGKGLDMPTFADDSRTFKRAPKAKP